VLFVPKNNRLNPPLPLLPPNKLCPSSQLLEHSEPELQDATTKYLGQKPAKLAVVLPGWSTGPLAQTTTCMFRKGDGRMTFTVMLQLEDFAFPHLLGAFSLQISFFSAPLPPMHCLHAAAALQPSPER